MPLLSFYHSTDTTYYYCYLLKSKALIIKIIIIIISIIRKAQNISTMIALTVIKWLYDDDYTAAGDNDNETKKW